ncbi:M43 family zinc metalloprotease [Sabulibacter ruber]|uniref:M43 family zinc metalloprotease n=1 Tax=Sabulibacter ruber TaxID=2811901 RepID=UPI001A95F909|nr:M43 family zinc metalloprotease [Sabulibacter ruber]
MSRKLLAVLFLFLLGISEIFAQGRSCGTMEYVQQLERETPNLRVKLQQQARQASTTGVKYGRNGEQPLGQVVTIPVVVHVVYFNNQMNISDAQIQSQINVLNKDFRRLNTDANKTPELFKNLAADTEIEFCLAKQDPNGEPTTGITRTRTSVTAFEIGDNKIKFSSTNGKDAWDTKRYLNIWVGRLNTRESILGYAQFPNSGPVTTDGVVIDYRYFGTTGAVTAPYNLGRTATHEVGHWLNLFHIWGDADCGDDQVGDTPTQQEANNGCPTFPHSTCNNTSDMFMNYMDYTDDACMNMFTKGQKDVMHHAINTYRSGLLTSKGCETVQVPGLDAALLQINSPQSVLCANAFTPAIVLRNRGTQTLTSAQIQYKIDNGTTQTFDWTGSLASFQSATLTIPELTVANGAHTITFSITSRNNAVTDANASNDALSTSFQVQGSPLPLQEGFESATFPPTGWAINNPDSDLTWQRTTLAAKSGSASAFMRNKEYSANGLVDELLLPPLDLTSRTSPKLTFQLAYALYSETEFSDTLEVWVSTNCGSSYQRLYQKAGQALTTTTPYFTKEEFIPTASQWRLETVNLASFASAKTVLIKFRHVTDFENNLYLDDVKVDGDPLGAEEDIALRALQVAPNPTTGTVFISSSEATISSIQVCDAVGKVLQEVTSPKHVRSQPIQLSINSKVNGIYLIRMTTDKGVVVRRVMLQQ